MSLEQKEEIISSLILSLKIFPTVVSINSILKNPIDLKFLKTMKHLLNHQVVLNIVSY